GLGVAIAAAREEVLSASVLHFVKVGGIRILADQLLHGRDGIFGATEFVVRPRLLIEDLVSVLIIRILGEDSVIESDCLEWPLGICSPEQSIGCIGVAARRD